MTTKNEADAASRGIDISQVSGGTQIFAALVAEDPERIAVRDGVREISYAALAAAAAALALELKSHGVGRGDVVATILPRSIEAVSASLAAWSLGAAFMHLDPADPDRRLSAALATAKARVVVGMPDTLPAIPVALARIDATTIGPDDAEYVPASDVTTEDVAYVVLTSGTSGQSKAVAVGHDNLLGYLGGLRSRIAPLEPRSWGLTTTLAADLGYSCVFGALLGGGALHMYERNVSLDPFALSDQLRRDPVECLKYTPTQLEALSRQVDLAGLLPTRVLLLGGEVLPPRLVKRLLDTAPHLAIFNHYGPAEATIGSLMHRVVARDATAARVPVGRPLPGVEVFLEAEGKDVAAVGVSGELLLGGTGLARGYVGAEPTTVGSSSLASSLSARTYATGDLMLRNERGDLEFLGRLDRQLKIRGHRVDPGEVEVALLAHSRATQALVVSQESTLGGVLELVAYVVSDQSELETLRAIQPVLGTALLPARVVRVDGIALTANGKPDLAAMSAASEPSPDLAAVRDQDFPRGDVEMQIAQVWCEVLGLDQVGRKVKFAELGGDSLKVLKVFGRLRRCHPELVIAELFEHPTVQQLARALGAGQERQAHGASIDL